MNSGQPMWSHERDTYSLTKKEKGGRVWEYLEDVVGWMEGHILPLSSENRETLGNLLRLSTLKGWSALF